jgi:nitrate reductase NapE component
LFGKIKKSFPLQRQLAKGYWSQTKAGAKNPKEITNFLLMTLTIKPQLAVTAMSVYGESKRTRIKG